MAHEKSTTKISGLTVDVYEPTSSPKATIMFSHGLWVGGWIWDTFASWFAGQGYACYVPTWAGRYDSKPVPNLGKLSTADFVEDALAIAGQIEPDVLIGESFGGLISMKVAEQRPLKALVLMNPAPPFRVTPNLTVIKSQMKYMGDLLGGKPNLPTEKDYKALILNAVPEPEASEFYKKICPDSGTVLKEASLGKIKVDPNKIKCPIYFVIGHRDVILPLKIHKRTARILGAEVASYPMMSHHTFSEEGWEQVASEMEQWLERKISSPVP